MPGSFISLSNGRRAYIARESAAAAVMVGKLPERELSDLPEVIYSEVRVLSADKLTRNFTLYPKSSLEGDAKDGTGVISCVFPYPIPIIREHLSGGFMLGSAPSDVYGRVINAEMVTEATSDGRPVSYVRGIFKITHPEAIEAILKERWLTVSAGMRVNQVFCSICGKDLCASEEPCEHKRGQAYAADEGAPASEFDILDENGDRICYWRMGPVQFLEVSFVNIPSDSDARVLKPDIGAEAASYAKFGSKIVRLSDGVDVTSTSELPRSMVLKESLDEVICCSDLSEGDLTSKDRKRLRRDQFCGDPDKKEFPVPDAAHVRLGFAMLKRYKGPTSKARIHACLVRKAKQLGVKHDPKTCPYCRRGEDMVKALLGKK